jgi:hypothetical protein
MIAQESIIVNSYNYLTVLIRTGPVETNQGQYAGEIRIENAIPDENGIKARLKEAGLKVEADPERHLAPRNEKDLPRDARYPAANRDRICTTGRSR